MKKYELTSETKVFLGKTLYRIKALVQFGNVNAGDLGGWIEKEENLSQSGNARVSGNAEVYGNAEVSGNARVSGNAEVCKIGTVFWIGAIGSRNGTTTFFRCKDGKIYVSCGCFLGDLEEFSDKVKQTHGDNEHGRVYMLAIEMAKARIVEEKNEVH
ncbi:hypothetical protein ACEVJK_12610 [Flintibacter sp. P01028]|uniref:hypothetical protein n=1 Tax=Flintibacter sp. P01028 TaxID=3342382 RepID=UPI0035B6015D